MVTTIVFALLNLILGTLSCHLLLTREKSISYCIVFFVAHTILYFSATISIVNSAFGETYLSRYVLFLLVFSYILYDYKVFRESFGKILFTMLSVWMFSNVFFLISAFILTKVIAINDTIYLNESFRQISIIIELFIRIIPILIFLSIRKVYRRFIAMADNETAYLVSFYPLIALLFLNENYRIDHRNYYNLDMKNIFFFISLIIMGYILVCFATISITKNIMLNQEIKVAESQFHLEQRNHKHLNDQIDNLSALTHDFRHHMSTIKSLLDSGKTEAANEYMGKYKQCERLNDIHVLSKNSTSDALINYYRSIALIKGIDFRTQINIPADIHINSIDLSVILGNCIENAVNACDKLCNSESKYIDLKSNIVGKQLVIIIKNSFNGIIQKEGDVFLSSSHEGRGIGISSVIAAVRKYKGHVDIEYNDNEFEVKIILPI